MLENGGGVGKSPHHGDLFHELPENVSKPNLDMHFSIYDINSFKLIIRFLTYMFKMLGFLTLFHSYENTRGTPGGGTASV